MQLLKQWPPNRTEKRKREKSAASPKSEDGGKKVKVDHNDAQSKNSISGAKDDRTSIFESTNALPSPPMQLDLHQQNDRSVSHNDKILPLSPLSRSPEHFLSDTAVGSPRCKCTIQHFFYFTFEKLHPLDLGLILNRSKLFQRLRFRRQPS